MSFWKQTKFWPPSSFCSFSLQKRVPTLKATVRINSFSDNVGNCCCWCLRYFVMHSYWSVSWTSVPILSFITVRSAIAADFFHCASDIVQRWTAGARGTTSVDALPPCGQKWYGSTTQFLDWPLEARSSELFSKFGCLVRCDHNECKYVYIYKYIFISIVG